MRSRFAEGETIPGGLDHAPRSGGRSRFGGRRDVAAAAAGLGLVVAAVVLPRLNLGVTPLVDAAPESFATFAGSAPIFGWWELHVGPGTLPAAMIGVLVVTWGRAVAQRLRWRAMVAATWLTSCAWAFSLAMVDGWQRGFAGRLTAPDEYLHQVPTITDVSGAVRGFADRILDHQSNSWTTHVSGHPPGALLTFVWLDRLGLGGGAWAGVLCLLVGSSAAAAVVVAVRALADERTARLTAPFVAVAPTAIWIAVSADGYFAGVAAWGIALLAVAVRRPARCPAATAAAAGLLLGWATYLNYGLALMALPVGAVLLSATDGRAALRALGAAVVAVLATAAGFALAGFWWVDGYQLVQQRYWQGVAVDRPFSYWVWANLASAVCAIGLGGVAGVARVIDVHALRRRAGLPLVLLGMLAAIACADASMLSKAEVERIWLPYTVWLSAAAVLLPPPSHRWWLAVNVSGALVLNHVILTNW